MSLDRKINRIQFLSGNSLKVIAVLTMLIDHLCKIVLQWLLSNYWGAMADNGQMSWERFREIDYFIRFDLQSIGTIAFPLFCFLLAEGFQHTRSKKRYIGLMLAFALISEVPFDIGFFSAYSRMEDTFPFYLKYQNVFFTLFLGLLTLVCLERFSCKSDLPVDRIKSAVLQVLSVVLFPALRKESIVTTVCRGSYSYQHFIFAVITESIKCCCSFWLTWGQRGINRLYVRFLPACLFCYTTESVVN